MLCGSSGYKLKGRTPKERTSTAPLSDGFLLLENLPSASLVPLNSAAAPILNWRGFAPVVVC